MTNSHDQKLRSINIQCYKIFLFQLKKARKFKNEYCPS